MSSGPSFPFLLLIISVLCLASSITQAIGHGNRLNFLMKRNHISIPVGAPPGHENVIDSCQELYHDQVLDHFNFHKEDTLEGGLWQQRYFFCDEYWNKEEPASPIFFYAGNEADVTLYLNASGLMWENAEAFGALLIFAEHRYYGKSQPFAPYTPKKMEYLSAEQALVDYSVIVSSIKEKYNIPNAPVIAFGGSYGGMLAAWWRQKYPTVIAGAIAASAPLLDFEGDKDGPMAIESFSHIVTRDASPEGGSSEHCANNVRAAWPIMFNLAKTSQGLQHLSEAFRLCHPLETEEKVYSLAYWIQEAWTSMAMGEYPYPSTYLLNGQSYLPAWPVQVACSSLDFPLSQASNHTLLEGLRNAVSVYYNYSGADLACFDLSAGANEETQRVEDHWNYQFCTEMFMPSGSDGKKDMFWPQSWNATEQSEACYERFGLRPQEKWISVEYGGIEALRRHATNIVFSNGRLDPWSGTGVSKSLSRSVVALSIERGGHHLDLMWSTPDDPKEVTDIRQQEIAYIKQWIEEYNRQRSSFAAEEGEVLEVE